MTGPAVTESEPTGTDAMTVLYKGPELPSWYEEGAKVNRKAGSFYYVKDDTPSLSLTHKGEDKIAATEVPADQDAFEKFVKDNSFPLFGALDGDTFSTYMERGNGMLWTLLPMKAENVDEVVEEKRAMMTEVAKELGAKYSVTWTNTDSFGKVLESMFGITEFPKIVVQQTVGGKKNFIYDGELTKDAILAYVKDVDAGNVKAHLKSEEIPASNDEPVKVIVGKTIETEVFTADKDVLLEIYAPWCGHCKKLDPEYTKVGKKVIKEGLSEMITIAKMDGTQNDSPVESISWTGFPTMYYIKAGNDTPMKYDGPRDAKGIWKWLKKNHSKADEIKEKLAAKKAAKDEL
jgi:protein disulfide-isomerase/protein disulfide-isomerase A1